MLARRARKGVEKSRAGDGEGDTVESAGKNAGIATFVDRKTKFLPAKRIPDKSAAALNQTALHVFKPIPAQQRNTCGKSGHGSGGIVTKRDAASFAAGYGIPTIITRGCPSAIAGLLSGAQRGTVFCEKTPV
jgi:hypothetical protein